MTVGWAGHNLWDLFNRKVVELLSCNMVSLEKFTGMISINICWCFQGDVSRFC